MAEMTYPEFSLYFTKYYSRLVRYCVMLIGVQEDAEDIVQSCYVKLWEKKYPADKVSNGAILFTIAKNSCFNYLKHKMVISNFEKAYLQDDISGEAVFEYDFLGIVNGRGVITDLNSFIRDEVVKLPDRCREIFIMSRYDALSNKEIADRLGISEPAVHKNIDRAVRKLKRQILK